MSQPKIFGIGFHKTGTTSLAAALSTLGYRVTGPNWVDEGRIADQVYDLAFSIAERFDAFQDNPWPILYREMDERYPGSKFVLTIRDTDQWIRSVRRHFGTAETPMRRWIYGYGSPVGHEDVYVRRYEKHNEEVLTHFSDRPRDLLVMDLARGDGWEVLCPFLGREIPEAPFPHKNRSSRRKWTARTEAVKSRIRSMLGQG